MKINYTSRSGKRSSITLSDALITTWEAAHPEKDSWESEADLVAALRESIEQTAQGNQPQGVTFVQMVESDLLGDIRDRLSDLQTA